MTDEELLKTALHGGEAEWTKLQEICRDRSQATVLARMLEQHATEESDAAMAWAAVLADMHPGLEVKLPPSRLD